MGKRPGDRYELLTCSWKGHHLVGTDAATVSAADRLVVRELDGLRWHRCLRCDGWFPKAPPEHPTRDRVPTRDEIEVPMRGPQLRDRYVLRLIAVDRLLHVFVLGTLAVLILVYLGHRGAIERDYDRIMSSLTGGPSGPNDLHGILAHFRHYLFIRPQHLYEIGLVAIAYAALEATEMVGLWFAKRWAEYLTFVATTLFVPLEVYEIVDKVSILKIVTLVVNLAIALYLLLAKRLFGLRGGHRALIARREALGGWNAIEANTAEPPRPRVAAATSEAGVPG